MSGMEQRAFSDHSYNQYLNEEKLMGSRCKGCGARYVPPRLLCVKCYGSDMEWVEMKGKGKLAAFTAITIAPPFMMAQGYDRKHPYCSGVVELEEGGRVDARIEGVDLAHPESIKVGTPMKVKFIHRQGTEKPETYLAFEPS
jgi:uncharacterized OB-fold protein